MNTLWISLAAISLVVLVVMYLGLYWRRPGTDISRQDQLVADYRIKLEELNAQLAAGEYSQDEFETEKANLDSSLLANTQKEGAKEQETQTPGWLVASVMASTIGVSSLVYFLNPGMDNFKAWFAANNRHQQTVENIVFKGAQLPELAPEDVVPFVQVLQGTLKMEPAYAHGWYVLGTLYRQYGQPQAALPFFDNAANLKPGQDDYQIASIGAAFEIHGGALSQSMRDKLAEILSRNPEDHSALMLYAYASFKAGEIEKARTAWETLLALPGLPERFKTNIRARIDGLTTHAKTENTSPAATAGASIRVNVSLPDGLNPSPTAQLFIFAKNEEGAGPPIAVRKETVAAFPVNLELNDAHRMMRSGKSLWEYDKVQVSAKLSLTGSATSSSGDMVAKPVVISMAQADPPGQIAVNLILSNRVQ